MKYKMVKTSTTVATENLSREVIDLGLSDRIGRHVCLQVEEYQFVAPHDASHTPYGPISKGLNYAASARGSRDLDLRGPIVFSLADRNHESLKIRIAECVANYRATLVKKYSKYGIAAISTTAEPPSASCLACSTSDKPATLDRQPVGLALYPKNRQPHSSTSAWGE